LIVATIFLEMEAGDQNRVSHRHDGTPLPALAGDTPELGRKIKCSSSARPPTQLDKPCGAAGDCLYASFPRESSVQSCEQQRFAIDWVKLRDDGKTFTGHLSGYGVIRQ